ncbi:MAG: HAMP domain-containing histidine kinase [Lachnospiraceae bacterium]|nr:HAMP domain-containing histidine kinase [Lachnospiraceae bacterium]
MKKIGNKDPRINASVFSLKHYILIFCAMVFLCGTYIALYFIQVNLTIPIYIFLSMVTYIFVMSAGICLIFAIIKKKAMEPVQKLSIAAQQVAAGDFSIRLEPYRADGLKDELEVLFDDFNTMAAELESTEMLKTDFVSNVSHELKTPLSVIQNYATIIENENISENDRREYAKKISNAANKLTTLTSNILMLSRLDNQKILPTLLVFNLSESISSSILEFDNLLDGKNINVYINLDQSIMIKSDKQLLSIVWNNLLSNAIKFTPEGGDISVTLLRKGGMANIIISDNGCGMDEKNLKHIFDKFYQAESSRTVQGNGLGLALVKKVIEIIDGSITVNSKINEGSTFTIILPIM